ncbi:MAG: MerR family transcriptional regulator [Mycobacteriaceae bacterium]|nr:MerR family transcriptional regulator [Mycobacteriaceae bacterium]
MNAQEWSIQDLAKAAGTTSRTLRHYGQLGLLEPSRTGANGYRYYDEQALVRLQRILLLRELGLGLPAVAEVLRGERAGRKDGVADALRTHLELLRQQRRRIDRQIASVRSTVGKLEKGEPLMANEVFDGFDHAQYKDEVIERWGKEAYDRSERWWESMGEDGRKAFQQEHADLAADWGRAHAAGAAVDSPQVMAIAARHHAWIGAGWGGREVTREALVNLADMYVADPRFARNYDVHGEGAAAYVRDALHHYATTL